MCMWCDIVCLFVFECVFVILFVYECDCCWCLGVCFMLLFVYGCALWGCLRLFVWMYGCLIKLKAYLCVCV